MTYAVNAGTSIGMEGPMKTDETLRKPIKGFIKGTKGPTIDNILEYGYIYDIDEQTMRDIISDLISLNEIVENNGRFYAR